MLKLRLLGNPKIQDDEKGLAGRAVQPRRLALLSLLALAPRKSLTRDKILAYLWPDSDTEQGRHLLSVAVYELRKALGEGVLLTAREDVALAPDAMSIDVDEFEAALKVEDYERAVDLYAGSLLDGFHINDAPEFERWLDAQRAHVARRYAEALDRVAHAREEAGDTVGAVAAWRRLSDHDPFSSRVVCGLMQALEHAGDRAGALQHARAHAALMKEEFGAEPDPEVAALADRLKTTPREAQLRVSRVGPAATRAEAAAPVAQAITSSPHVASKATTNPPTRRRVAQRRSRSIIGILATTLVLTLVWHFWRSGSISHASSDGGNITIAVLPFDNLTPGDTTGDFSNGVTDEITSALGRVAGLSVVSRTSAFAVGAHQDARDVGRALNAGHIVEGTVRRLGDRVRVTARLINTGNGLQIWSKDYDNVLDTHMRNVLLMQEKIAQSVVSELAKKFGRTLTYDASIGTLPRDVEAFELYSAGKRFFHRRTVANLLKALENYESAIEHDSTYALAYAGKAEVYAVLGAYDYGAMKPSAAFTTARASAERALVLDPNLAEAHSALASVKFNYDWDLAAAETEYKRAIQLNDGYATARHWYSLLLLSQRRNKEAFEQIIRAGELDPLSSVTRTGLARHYYMTRDFKRAISEYERTVASDSTFVTAQMGLGLSYTAAQDYPSAIRMYETAGRVLGMRTPLVNALLANAYGHMGKKAEAQQHLDQLQAAAAKRYVPAEYFAVAYIGMGEIDKAFAALERAVANRSSGVVYLEVEPVVDPLRNDPRFAALVQKVGLSRR